MNAIWLIPGILSGCVIFIQDFRERRISILPLFLIFLSGILFRQENPEVWTETGINLIFILANLVVVSIIFKMRGASHFWNHLFGLGDLFMLIALTPWFGFLTFIPFYSGSLLVSLFGAFLMGQTQKGNTIPLAGWLALCHIAFLPISFFYPDLPSTLF